MDLENVMNFRDLGGTEVMGGRVIKCGLFYRSATPDDASDKDIDKLKELNIKTIFDFRYPSEVKETNVSGRINAVRKNLPLKMDSARICNLQENPTLKNALIQLDAEDMRIAYRTLPFNNDSYRELIEEIRSGNLPVLFHCTAGKDRAGTAAAIVLLLLGAGREAVVADYLKTAAHTRYIISQVSGHINFLVRKKIINKMMPVFLADESYINAAMDAIISKYGTFDKYFEGEYGIKDAELSRIRNEYTVIK